MSPRALVIVDAANVVGSVPDGWWRDRAAATGRLRDSLAGLSAAGLAGVDAPGLVGLGGSTGPVDVVLVVEGEASGVPSSPTVRVVAAPESADDTIVGLVREARESAPQRALVVITADRALRQRVAAMGVQVLGPSSLSHLRGRARSRDDGCASPTD